MTTMILYITDPKERQARLKAVAEDVIKQLDTRRFLATKGRYLTSGWDYGDEEKSRTRGDLLYRAVHSQDPTEVQETLKKVDKCDVCAIGAIFVSYVEQFDGVAASSKALDAKDAIVALFGRGPCSASNRCSRTGSRQQTTSRTRTCRASGASSPTRTQRVGCVGS